MQEELDGSREQQEWDEPQHHPGTNHSNIYYKLRGGELPRPRNATVMLGSIMPNTFQRHRAVPMPVYKALVRPQVVF